MPRSPHRHWPARVPAAAATVPLAPLQRRSGGVDPHERRMRTVAIGLIALTVAAVLVNLGLSVTRNEEAALQRMRDTSANYAHVIEEQTSSSFAAVEVALTALARSGRLVPAPDVETRARNDALLAETARSLPFVRAIWTTDAEGTMVQDSERLPGRYSLADRRYFRVHRERADVGPFIDRMIISKHGVLTLPLSVRPETADGRFAGIVAAALDPRHLHRHYASIDVGEDGFVALRAACSAGRRPPPSSSGCPRRAPPTARAHCRAEPAVAPGRRGGCPRRDGPATVLRRGPVQPGAKALASPAPSGGHAACTGCFEPVRSLHACQPPPPPLLPHLPPPRS